MQRLIIKMLKHINFNGQIRLDKFLHPPYWKTSNFLLLDIFDTKAINDAYKKILIRNKTVTRIWFLMKYNGSKP